MMGVRRSRRSRADYSDLRERISASSRRRDPPDSARYRCVWALVPKRRARPTAREHRATELDAARTVRLPRTAHQATARRIRLGFVRARRRNHSMRMKRPCSRRHRAYMISAMLAAVGVPLWLCATPSSPSSCATGRCARGRATCCPRLVRGRVPGGAPGTGSGCTTSSVIADPPPPERAAAEAAKLVHAEKLKQRSSRPTKPIPAVSGVMAEFGHLARGLCPSCCAENISASSTAYRRAATSCLGLMTVPARDFAGWSRRSRMAMTALRTDLRA